MKKILLIVLSGLLFSCVKDLSTLIYPENDPNFSSITITSPTEQLSVDYGQEFIFTPVVTQKIASKSLKYIWTANYIQSGTVGEIVEIGEGATLKYTFPKYGTYRLRLEVQNEDYSAFKTWEINVRVYDSGYFVLGNDDSGKSNIAFARSLSQTDILEGKELTFITDIINKVNPSHNIKDVVRIVKSILRYGRSDAYLHIFTKDKIYIADPNTFLVFNVISFSELLPGEYIKKVSVYDTYLTGSYIFTTNGRLVGYQKPEFLVYRMDNWGDKIFDDAFVNLIYTSGANVNGGEALVDYANSKIWMSINYHNGNLPVNNTSGINASQNNFGDNYRPNTYQNMDILSVFRMNGATNGGTPYNLFAVAKDRSNPLLIKIVEFTTSTSTGITPVNEFSYTSSSPVTFRRELEMVPNARYSTVYYSDGNKIYAWYPKNVPPNNQLPANPSITLGAGKSITTMSVSYDMKELYVGFYDQNSSNALKGGFYIYNCSEIGVNQNIQPIKKFENITTRPVQILYKSTVWDKPVSF
jgi:hypothetical protein